MNCMCGEPATHILNNGFVCRECLITKIDRPLKAHIIPLQFIQDVEYKVNQVFEGSDARKTMAHILQSRGISTTLIAKFLNRTQSTVVYLLQSWKDLYQTDKRFKQLNDTIWI